MVVVIQRFAMGEMVMFQQMGFGWQSGAVGCNDRTDDPRTGRDGTPGDRNWYLPSWLHWLPDFRVDGKRGTADRATARAMTDD